MNFENIFDPLCPVLPYPNCIPIFLINHWHCLPETDKLLIHFYVIVSDQGATIFRNSGGHAQKSQPCRCELWHHLKIPAKKVDWKPLQVPSNGMTLYGNKTIAIKAQDLILRFNT